MAAKKKINATVYRELPVEPILDWTPKSCKAALIEAQNGYLAPAADLWTTLNLDNRIQQAIKKRARKLLGLPLSFEPGRGRLKNQAVRALEAQEDFFYAFPEDTLAELIAWGIGLGVGIAQNVWETPEDHGGRDVPRLKIWNPRWLRHNRWTGQWLLQTRDDGQIEINPGDGTWILYTPFGRNEPWNKGLWWPCVPWFLLKQLGLIDWSQHNRQHGSPPRVGTTPKEGVTKADRDKFASDLARLVGGGSLVKRDGWTVELLEALKDNSLTFSRAIEMADTSFDITINGNNLTTSVKSGSLAAAEVQERGEEDQTAFDGETLSTCLHDQSLTFWGSYNYGRSDVAPWPRWDTTPPEDLAKKATTLKTLGEGLPLLNIELAKQGKEIDLEELAERYRLPIRDLTKPVEPAQPSTTNNEDSNAATDPAAG